MQKVNFDQTIRIDRSNREPKAKQPIRLSSKQFGNDNANSIHNQLPYPITSLATISVHRQLQYNLVKPDQFTYFLSFTIRQWVSSESLLGLLWFCSITPIYCNWANGHKFKQKLNQARPERGPIIVSNEYIFCHIIVNDGLSPEAEK